MRFKHFYPAIIFLLIFYSCKKNKIINANINGRVTDAATGLPMKDFRIIIYGQRPEFEKTLHTDQNGYYSLEIEYSDGKKTKLNSQTGITVEARGEALPNGTWNDEYYLFFDCERFEGRDMNNLNDINFQCACPGSYKPVLVCKGPVQADSITYSLTNLSVSKGSYTQLVRYAYPAGNYGITVLSGMNNYIKFYTYTSGVKKEYRDTIFPSCQYTLIDTIFYK